MSPRKALLVGAPIVAFAVLALGLRIGAADDERAAMVYGSPPPTSHAGLAWQIVTLEDKKGLKEPVVVTRLSVQASLGAKQVAWEGATNADGVAEVPLAFEGIKLGDAIDLTVKDADRGTLLAQGRAVLGSATDRTAIPPGPWFATYARRVGEVALDVAVFGRKLAPGFPTPIWVRATDASTGAALANVEVEAVPDGLKLVDSRVRTDDRGWAMITATALSHVVGLDLKATAKDARRGEWGATLEVAPGGSASGVPMRLVPNAAATFEVAGAMPHLEYVEITDAEGRIAGQAFALQGDSPPRGAITVPKLSPGLYWIVTSNTPASMEGISPSAIARPFAVAASDAEALKLAPYAATCDPPADPSAAARALAPCLATQWPPAVPRWVAIDGFAGKRARDKKTHARGAAIAVGALVAAAMLETLLILSGAIEARRNLKRLAEGGHAATERFGVLNIAIGLLVALLGFALVAAFVLRAG